MVSVKNIISAKSIIGDQMQMAVRAMAGRFLKNEKGDLLGTIGVMMVITLAVVAVHGLIKGWLPDFVGRIFALLDGMV